MKGIFISMEGPDGSGKSTQIAMLRDYLLQKGYDTIVTREPGGTKISEKIRELILDINHMEMGKETEMMLYAAARAQLVHEVILPSVKAGKAVICDRYVDSSAVYQGIARGLGVETVYQINQYAIQGFLPDLTIHLDLSAEEGIRRKKNQAELDRMELQDIEFHKRVAEGYRELAKRETERIKTIDATLSPENVHQKIVFYVEQCINK